MVCIDLGPHSRKVKLEARKGTAFPLCKTEKSEIKALETLQNALLSPPKLTLPITCLRCTLDVEAVDKQVGFIISLEYPGGPVKAVGYCSG